ncbi:MAG: glycosyl transferase family A, partial [Salinicola sp.]|nr:glycosyl transferase family A [Salinicola sp.]
MPGKVPVSCVITNFNGRGLIEGAIASVLRQSVEVAEIIVADDASTDG